MNTRILHCSTSLENYYLCLGHRVAGFGNRGPQSGDLVYPAVKMGKKSLCGARLALDVLTDNKTRKGAKKDWIDEIIDYVNDDEGQSSKVISRVKALSPQVKDCSINRDVEKFLTHAFNTNLHVFLIIDEQISEQKSTIKNVVSSFKLPTMPIPVCRVCGAAGAKINLLNWESEFVLMVQ